jgi:RNA polymerase sigma-70 factor (ECF subfamily)
VTNGTASGNDRIVLSLNQALAQIEVAESPDLVERARRGDSDSFCELCRIHERRLLRQAFHLCGDTGVAEDLAQETLLAAWKSIRRYNDGCQFFTWLCAILLNRHRTALRRKRPMALSALKDLDPDTAHQRLETVADTNPSPAQLSESADRAAFLRECLNSLPAKHREVIYLRFYVNQSLDEIAAALRCSTGTVKSRLYHALEKLRTMKSMKSTRSGG